MDTSPISIDIDVENLNNDESLGIELLIVKRAFFREKKTFINLDHPEIGLTRKKKGIKYKNISSCVGVGSKLNT